jgi:hypothetical protein
MTKVTPRDILIAPGCGKYKMTFTTATDAVKPGQLVTQTGTGAQKLCDWPDEASDALIGVVGCLPDHDIDTAYAAGTTVPVYMRGSKAVVWVYFRSNGGALVAGSPVSHGGLAIDGAAIVGIDGVNPLFDHLGYSTHWHDQIASVSWVQVRLSK